MAVQNITYDDKSYLNQNSDIPDVNKVNDSDMNEIKSVVNNNANETSNNTNVLNNLCTYSTSEIDTGMIWYDGSPIYKKVIPITQNISNTDVSFPTGITNLSEICFFTGALHRKTYNRIYDLGTQYISELKYDESTGNLIVNTTTSEFVIDKGNITIYYTKTS